MSTATKTDLVIKWDLLREAYQAIKSSVNDELLELEQWKCGTLACAAGHLAQMPKFYERGLHIRPVHALCPDASDYCIVYREPGQDGTLYNFSALRYFFGLPATRADELFGARMGVESQDEFENLTDKEIWLLRMCELFKDHNQPPLE